MSVDNRTELNDCDNATGFTGDGASPSVNVLTGQRYEGTGSIDTQHSDADEQMNTVQTSGGGGTFSLDLSDSTLYLMVKDNLVDTFANGGVQFVIGDGTDLIGYDVGGNDAVGLSLSPFFNVYKLDGSASAATPGTFNAYAGTEANLTYTAITAMGYGSLHLAKAQGNVANVFLDRMTYIANGSYALTINGGTIGTPETMVDVQGDDVTNGWGMINNPIGSQYQFFAPTEWGNASTVADVYFTADDEQWFWIGDNAGGRAIGADNFPFRIVGNATDTIDIKWTNVVIVNTGTRAQFIAGDANVNVMQFDNVTFTDIGAITFTTQSASNRFAIDSTFANCDQVDPNTIDMDDCTFNGSNDATGAMLLDENQDGTQNLTGMTFNSDGTGYGIRIAPTGAGPFTYNFDNFANTSYGADDTADAFVRIAPVTNSANITINLLNSSDAITVDDTSPYTGTVTINNAQTILVAGLAEGTAVKIVADETVGTITVGDIILETLADSAGEATISPNYESAFDPSGLDIIIRANNQGLCNAAIADDNGVFTDETTNSNSASVNDMNLLPVTPVVNQDRYVMGHSEQFTQLKVHVSTAGTGGFTITWQYWNGAWVNLSGVTDGTSSFSVLGKNIVSFTLPGDWVTTTINSQGPFYYVRAAYTAGTVTITPLGRSATLDVTRYLPIEVNRVFSSTGLTATLAQAEDSIAIFS